MVDDYDFAFLLINPPQLNDDDRVCFLVVVL